jgi:GT2 family glycosyltransferase
MIETSLSQSRPITVSVISHTQGRQVMALLQDLERHCGTAIAQVIVTFNVPEPLPFVPGNFGFPVAIIANAQPKGFGANHNQAFARCASDWFLIVNPDVRIAGDVLSALLALAGPRDAIVAPQEVSPGGARLDSLRGPITPLELLRRRMLKRPPAPPQDGGWVKGMFMLARARALRQVGGFDERFFMYCEDADLCARLMLVGWRVRHAPQVSVTHDWQRASRRSGQHLRWHLSSLLRMWGGGTFWRYCALVRRWNRSAPDAQDG